MTVSQRPKKNPFVMGKNLKSLVSGGGSGGGGGRGEGGSKGGFHLQGQTLSNLALYNDNFFAFL